MNFLCLLVGLLILATVISVTGFLIQMIVKLIKQHGRVYRKSWLIILVEILLPLRLIRFSGFLILGGVRVGKVRLLTLPVSSRVVQVILWHLMTSGIPLKERLPILTIERLIRAVMLGLMLGR